MPKINLADIEEYTCQALVNFGAKDWIARSISRAVRRSEETGNIICGLYYLESYCKQLESGRVDGQVDPIISQPRKGAVKSDALFGFAQPALRKGILLQLNQQKKMVFLVLRWQMLILVHLLVILQS